MAVLIQFTTVVIRIDRLLAADPDGVDAVQARWSPSWRDQHLLAVAFMDMGARDLAAELEQMGLTLRDTSSGTRVWQDICVIDYYDGPTNPCPWLEYDPTGHIGWLKGTAPGELAGPPHRHEDAPLQVSPQQFQQLVQSQHPALAPAAKPLQNKQSTALAPSHESRLLPLTQQLAAELLNLLPVSAKLEAIIFMAHFPEPGEVVRAGLILHELEGERRAFRLAHYTDEARRLLTALSSYASEQRLTSIEIKIAADGQTTTRFGVAPPLSSEDLQAHMDRLYGNIPKARPPTLPAVGCIGGLLRAMFGPKLKLYPLPALQHSPQGEPLSMYFDHLDRIQEGWDEPPPTPAAASSASSAPSAPSTPRPPGPAFDLAAFHSLEAARLPPAPTATPRPVPTAAVAAMPGKQLMIPDQEGVLLVEAREFRRVTLAELHRSRPTLRFDPITEQLSRDLGPGLGELRFGTWKGYLNRLDLHADGIPSFDALLSRIQPVLIALGGMGPIVSALGTPHPANIREVTHIGLDELRAYLVADSPYGRLVYPCWLLGGPPHTRVGLDLSVGLTDGRPNYGYTATVAHASDT